MSFLCGNILAEKVTGLLSNKYVEVNGKKERQYLFNSYQYLISV